MQGTIANQAAAESMTSGLSDTLNNMQTQFNKTATLIECSANSGQFRVINGEGGRFGQGSITTGPGSGAGPQGFLSGFNQAYINYTVIEEIRGIDGVKDVIPTLETSSNETVEQIVTTPRGNFSLNRPLYTLRGVSLRSANEYSLLPTNITEGRNLQEGDSRVCLMTKNLTDHYGVNEGGQVSLNGTSFTVVGIYEPAAGGQNMIGANIVYTSIEDARVVTGLSEVATKLDIYVQDTSYVSSISDMLKAAYSDFYIATNEDRLDNLENMQDMYQSSLDTAQNSLVQSQIAATQEIAVAVVATSLIVLFVMLYTVRERTKEIGTLKAIGFSNGNIMSQFVLEGAILSLVAGAVGIAIGAVAAPFLSSLLVPSINMFGGTTVQNGGGIFTSPVQISTIGGGTINPTAAAVASVSPQLLLTAFAAAIVLGLLGSLYPAWRAARTKPAEAMRYE
jgi:ABC-type antimicrobial peptide transport system permease subunit